MPRHSARDPPGSPTKETLSLSLVRAVGVQGEGLNADQRCEFTQVAMIPAALQSPAPRPSECAQRPRSRLLARRR